MQIDSAGVERITNEVLDHEEQYVALPLDVFLEELGMVNSMQTLQDQIAALFAE